MENEVKEVLDEVVGNESSNVSRKSSKVAIFGLAATAVALLVAFRKKISARVDGRMVKRLTKRGYTVHTPVEVEVIPDNLLEEIE